MIVRTVAIVRSSERRWQRKFRVVRLVGGRRVYRRREKRQIDRAVFPCDPESEPSDRPVGVERRDGCDAWLEASVSRHAELTGRRLVVLIIGFPLVCDTDLSMH